MSGVQDPARIKSLRDSGLLDQGLPGIDRLLRVAKHALRTTTVMFSAVDVDRQVFVGQIGLPHDWVVAGETPLSHSYCQIVVDEDRPLIITNAAGDARVCDNPATVEASIGAYIGVPVRSPDGLVLGSFCAIHDEARIWTDNELETLADLAAAVEVDLRLRKTTEDLGDQLAAEQLEKAFEQSMASVAAATSRSWTARSVLNALVKHGQEAARASLISVALVDQGQLRYFHGAGVSEAVAGEWVVGSIDDPVPMAYAIKHNETVVLPTYESFARWPMFVDAVHELGIQSFVALPVGDTDGGSRAVVALGWAEPMPSLNLPPSVLRLGALARNGLDRAHSHQTARDHADLLESFVIPAALPEVDSLDLAGMYLPPTAGQRVGGDLYEVIDRGDNRVALIVADAAGHDVAASRATNRLRIALNMLTLERRSPAEILRYVNDYLQKTKMSTLITCVYALVDTTENSVTIANAGHPQPRLRQADNSIIRVGPTSQPLLGFGPYPYAEETVAFEPGDILTMFTDGLIERRDTDLHTGEAWLEAELAELGEQDAQAITDHLRTALTIRQDDVAVLVARNTRGHRLPSDVLVQSWTGDGLRLAEARAAIIAWLEVDEALVGTSTSSPAPSTRFVDDVVLVATELLTNARTASRPPNSTIRLEASRTGDGIELLVTNQGGSFTSPANMPGDDGLRGRGLAIARSMCDIEIESNVDTVTVRACFGKQR